MSSRKDSTSAHLQSLLKTASTPLLSPQFTPALASSSSQTVNSEQPRHSTSSISSITSESSYASSYAFGLRRSEPDLRLLRKKSKPSQHLRQKRTNPAKSTIEVQKQLTPYRPKEVEDTVVVESTTKHVTPEFAPLHQLKLTLPTSLLPDPPIVALNKSQTFRLQMNKKPSSVPIGVERPNLARSVISQQVGSQQPPTPRSAADSRRHLRFETPQLSESGRERRLKPQSSVRPSRIKIDVPIFDFQEPHRNYGRQPEVVTPPEAEPGRTQHRKIHLGDSYFHTFGAETMYSKEFVPTPTPMIIDEPPAILDAVLPSSPLSPSQQTSTGAAPSGLLNRTGTSATVLKKRKSSAFLSLFRKTAFRDNVFADKSVNHDSKAAFEGSLPEGEADRASQGGTLASPVTPGILISSPGDDDRSRQKSILPELRAPSYFSRSLQGSERSNTPSPSPSPGPSPMALTGPKATHKALNSSRARYHHRSSSSDQLSPMARPGTRAKMRHRSTLRDSSEQSDHITKPREDVVQAETHVLVGDDVAMSKKQRASHVTPSGAGVHFASDINLAQEQQMPERSTVLDKKASLFGGFLSDIRKVSSLSHMRHVDDTVAAKKISHRASLNLRVSFPKLSVSASHSSMNVRNSKLVRKRSMAIEQMQEELEKEHARIKEKQNEGKAVSEHPVRQITAADLEVTNFYQTPFSKRYYDTKWATEQAIRALIEEHMDEDDDEDDEIVLGFEQDVPDHLPSSPLCPLHPKHKSGGKAICPMHRKYRRKKPTMQNPTHKVEIVFDLRDELVKQRATGMGIDGAETISSALAETPVTLEHVRRRSSKQRDSEQRGRRRERGECALERRRKRRKEPRA